MPDMHEGYGFPIGGVAAFDAAEGVVSPGGVGYDINCGVRLVRTDVRAADLGDRLHRLVHRDPARRPRGRRQRGRHRDALRATTSTTSSRPAPRGPCGRASAPPTTWSSPRPAAGLLAPTRPRSLVAPASAARRSSAPSGQATTSPRSRWSTRCSTKRPRRRSGSRPAVSPCSSTPGSRGLGYQVCDDALEAMHHAAAPPPPRVARPSARGRADRLARGRRATSRRCGPRPTSPGPTAR